MRNSAKASGSITISTRLAGRIPLKAIETTGECDRMVAAGLFI